MEDGQHPKPCCEKDGCGGLGNEMKLRVGGARIEPLVHTPPTVWRLELVKIDAIHADEPISSLPREVLWRGGPRPAACGT